MKRTLILILVIVISSISFSDKNSILFPFLIVDEKGNGNEVIVIFKEENGKINGYITDISNKDKPNTQLYDTYNPNKELRDRPLIGLKIVKNFEYDSKRDMYINGQIYDPTSGNWFYCSGKVRNNKLHMRGSLDYLGVLGLTKTWPKYNSTSF